jgi:hypothetical protein
MLLSITDTVGPREPTYHNGTHIAEVAKWQEAPGLTA